jgi:proteic killer suppression protein
MKNVVDLSPQAKKDLTKCPGYILEKFNVWKGSVELRGLTEVRKTPGFHDEPLHGKREGQRSIRLNRSWRAFYRTRSAGKIELVSVLEVTKHEY